MATRQHVSTEQAKQAAERIRAGESTLMAESTALGFHRRVALRAALTDLLGSREAYRKLLAEGRASRAHPAVGG